MAIEYSKKPHAELIEILKSRSLPHSGKKADLVARLQEADKAEEETKSKTISPTTSKTESAPANADVQEDTIDWDDDDVTASAPPTGGKGAASNPTSVPNQKVDIDPSTTHD